MRQRMFCLMNDYKTAFDRVNRTILLKKLDDMGMPRQMIKMIKNLFTNSKVTIDGQEINTYSSVAQGGCSSPIIWLCYVNDIVIELNEATAIMDPNTGLPKKRDKHTISSSYFFADDLVCFCRDHAQLDRVIEILKKWSLKNEIQINFDKSAILVIRKDKRTRKYWLDEYKGYPIKTECKYLGIRIDDSLQLDIDMNLK